MDDMPTFVVPPAGRPQRQSAKLSARSLNPQATAWRGSARPTATACTAVCCRTILAAGLLALLVVLPAAQAGEPAAGPPAIEPDGIAGSLFLCGGGHLSDELHEKFVELAGGKSARLVIIPTACPDDSIEESGRELVEIFKASRPEAISLLHTRSHDESNDEKFGEPIRRATGVWIGGGRQTLLAAAYTGTRVERELCALLARGGIVGGTSAGAACQSRVMIVRGRIHEPPGLGLIPGAIIDQHFLARGRKPRLFDALARHPDLVGLGIDEGAALLVQGRTLRCLGDSTVTVCLAAGSGRAAKEVVLKSGETSDLTMLRRAARNRTLPPFPPAKPVDPEVPQGALVIVGGGKMPGDVVQKFIELAGGPDALIVVLPTANPDPLPVEPRDGAFLARAGAKNVQVLKARRRQDVESPEFLAVLKNAGGIWFGGGRQWRFVDAYEGTAALEAFRDVLRRGGVIGGSSAGATIQGEYLVRGSPLGNEEMMADGYERGFAFLPGTAIDQHFSQRKRYRDMSALVAAHPQLLGIGLDESTAIVVRGHVAGVIGEHQAHFYDRSKPAVEGNGEYVSIGAGGNYDLKAREPLPAGEKSPAR